MKETSLIRRRLTLIEREEVLTRYRTSQLTQREFAQQSGMGLSTLQSWLRKAANRPKPATPVFLPVPNLLASAPPPPAFRIQWPDGLALEVRPGFAVQELAALLPLLRAL
jgi:hypothetical protein